jgi:thymidylate synthase
MIALPVVESLSEAWVLGLERAVAEKGGRLVHMVMTVSQPGLEISSVRQVLDQALAKADRQSIETVAGTIFPAALYTDPEFDWFPEIDRNKEALLDDAASMMYQRYGEMLPLLLTADGNRMGTYFGRMVSWPGKEAGGVNQIAARVTALRRENRERRGTNNTLDIDVAADSVEPVRGVQVYAATDKRIRGFPCLTHIDLTLYNRRLHCTAVYRHQYLFAKAYGNMVGLSMLLEFLCQQSGYELGELVVHATLADSERGKFPTVAQLATAARSALNDTHQQDAERRS